MARYWDETPLQLKCGTKLYRAAFGNKQCVCKFTRQLPVEEWDSSEPMIDVRAAVGELTPGCTTLQILKMQQMTYDQVVRACLKHRLTKTASK
jgi:hypothetical protein